MAAAHRALVFLIAFVLGIVLAMVWFHLVWDVWGQQECNRADCSSIGDLSYGSKANIPLAVCFLLAGAAVSGTRTLIRRSRRKASN